jgi:hypothetical protein
LKILVETGLDRTDLSIVRGDFQARGAIQIPHRLKKKVVDRNDCTNLLAGFLSGSSGMGLGWERKPGWLLASGFQRDEGNPNQKACEQEKAHPFPIGELPPPGGTDKGREAL